MNLAERVIVFVARVAVFHGRRRGELTVEHHREFVKLLRQNPHNEELGQSFREMLIATIAMEAELAGVCSFEWADSAPTQIADGGLIDLLNWIIEHWQKIAEIIVFIISLFV